MAKRQSKLELFKLEYLASKVKINHCLVRGAYPTEIFLKTLDEEETSSIIALFKLFGIKEGKLSNPTKFKKLEQYQVAIFEFKDYQVRLAGFWRPEFNFNLIYGFKKKKDNWPQADLKAMRNNYDDFISEERLRK